MTAAMKLLLKHRVLRVGTEQEETCGALRTRLLVS